MSQEYIWVVSYYYDGYTHRKAFANKINALMFATALQNECDVWDVHVYKWYGED